MGGVVDFVEDKIIDPIVDTGKSVVGAIEDAVEDTVDVVEKAAEIVVDVARIALKPITISFEIAYDIAIKGENFSNAIANQINDVADRMSGIYDNLLDDTLGIDDGKFFGISGGIFSKLGMLTRDFTKEHATQTIGIGIIVALLVFMWWFPPAYGFAGAITLAAFEAGITSTILMMGIYYGTLAAISFGISAIVSGIIDGAVLAMYGQGLLDKIFSYESGQEMLRIAGLTAVMDATIFDRLAGGWMYDSQFAGGVYYDAASVANLDISVGGEFKLTPHAVNTQFGYIDSILKDLPGDSNFSVLKTNL